MIDVDEFVLAYEVVRRAADPDAAVQEFFITTYEAGADLGGWDRLTLEPTVVPTDPQDVRGARWTRVRCRAAGLIMITMTRVDD